MKSISFLVATLVVCLSGCANPINLRTSDTYLQAARNSEHSGDWHNAAMYYSRAWGNAQMGNAHPVRIAWLRYDYGRALGVICKWKESETALNEAYNNLRSNNVKEASWALIELTRMSLAQKDYPKALLYYDRIMPTFDETIDPLGAAVIYEEYAEALHQSGQAGEAQKYIDKVKKIRIAFPEGVARTDITPHGTQCNNK